jgi:hypothetical protein
MKRPTRTERVAFKLERDALPTIGHRLSAVSSDDELTSLQLSDNERNGHLPQLIPERLFIDCAYRVVSRRNTHRKVR